MKFIRWCRRYKVLCGCLVVLVVFVLYVAGSLWYSYNGLIVRRYTLESDAVTEPIRVVLISDLHDSELGRGNVRIVDKIQELQPDLILMAGDFMESQDEDAGAAIVLAEQLLETAPVYFSLGNQEITHMERCGTALIEELEAVGVPVLEQEYVDIEIRGQAVRLGGMYDYAFAMDDFNSTNPETMEPAMYEFLTEFQSTDALKLMMAHRPEAYALGEAAETWDIDLVLSGHDHGGQVVLPFLGGLWAGDQGYWPEYVTGLHEIGRIHMVITNGLGSGDELLPRFNNPPEIVMMEIIPVRDGVD